MDSQEIGRIGGSMATDWCKIVGDFTVITILPWPWIWLLQPGHGLVDLFLSCLSGCVGVCCFCCWYKDNQAADALPDF